jgi:hypothetical protein
MTDEELSDAYKALKRKYEEINAIEDPVLDAIIHEAVHNKHMADRALNAASLERVYDLAEDIILLRDLEQKKIYAAFKQKHKGEDLIEGALLGKVLRQHEYVRIIDLANLEFDEEYKNICKSLLKQKDKTALDKALKRQALIGVLTNELYEKCLEKQTTEEKKRRLDNAVSEMAKTEDNINRLLKEIDYVPSKIDAKYDPIRLLKERMDNAPSKIDEAKDNIIRLLKEKSQIRRVIEMLEESYRDFGGIAKVIRML